MGFFLQVSFRMCNSWHLTFNSVQTLPSFSCPQNVSLMVKIGGRTWECSSNTWIVPKCNFFFKKGQRLVICFSRGEDCFWTYRIDFDCALGDIPWQQEQFNNGKQEPFKEGGGLSLTGRLPGTHRFVVLYLCISCILTRCWTSWHTRFPPTLPNLSFGKSCALYKAFLEYQ